ncbi:3-hydroxyacyl-CoA dehydrogenase [Microbacterium sp. MYb62]|uniref:3-hydroxyacyl-CoA dehydrogenase n=1 Tax=Microbacterium sp. MYb62 TaxID=1848690 RepID=UPI001C615BEA|nr:3-hydroxyacyl-CoA dehydrogenase [Microbacterium sp. MYb62]
MPAAPHVAVIGSGSIGVAFAVVFARAGFEVAVTDVDADALARGRSDLDVRLELLENAGMLGAPRGEVAARVRFGTDVARAVGGAELVQECAPEQKDVKRAVFREVAAAAPAHAVLASSASAILPSEIAIELPDDVAARVIVGHPGNPPYLLPVIEVVPTPRTSPDALGLARSLYAAAGLRPVTIRREVEGFVFNRLQGALLREAYCLVRDGVVDVDDIDEIVRSGLGRRWSVIGPFETSDLNTRGGIASHAVKMGPAYGRMGAERGQHDPWTPELVEEVEAQRRALLPLEAWEARGRWRDDQLLAHTALWEGAAATAR